MITPSKINLNKNKKALTVTFDENIDFAYCDILPLLRLAEKKYQFELYGELNSTTVRPSNKKKSSRARLFYCTSTCRLREDIIVS